MLDSIITSKGGDTLNNDKPNNPGTYYAEPLANVTFEDYELKLMGVTFIESLSKLKEGMLELGIDDYEEGEDISQYGFALGKIGNIDEPYWAIFELGFSFQYVLDIKNGIGFYKITEELEGIKSTLFNKVYLREESLLEDLQYYIDLRKQSEAAPIGVSDYLN